MAEATHPGCWFAKKAYVGAPAGGTTLHYELTGKGPAVMFISGATGDAGHFHKVVRLLEDQFTVLTYDRRGNSRSPCAEGWTQTSCDEQADDAAALLQTLGLAQASVFGSSSGAIIALNLALRHRALVQRLIVHEPPLVYAFAAPDDVMNQLTSLVECGRSSGGSRGAMEAFLRSVAGDAPTRVLEEQLQRTFRVQSSLSNLVSGAGANARRTCSATPRRNGSSRASHSRSRAFS